LCIAEPQAIGEIDSSFDPIDLAEFLLASWEGAILRMKVEGSPPRSTASRTLFSKLYFPSQIQEVDNEGPV
jgi:TetR/AcrR family transcriptional repressor of nem operon